MIFYAYFRIEILLSLWFLFFFLWNVILIKFSFTLILLFSLTFVKTPVFTPFLVTRKGLEFCLPLKINKNYSYTSIGLKFRILSTISISIGISKSFHLLPFLLLISIFDMVYNSRYKSGSLYAINYNNILILFLTVKRKSLDKDIGFTPSGIKYWYFWFEDILFII